MAQPTNREIVERYLAVLPGDQDTLRALRHEEFVEDWPQSGERIRGAENMAQIDAHYPGGMPTGGVERVVGSEDRWVMTPSFTLLHVSGTGDVYTALSRARYPDGSDWWIATFLEVRDAKIFRVTTLFAPRIEAPEWRAAWVEPIPAEGRSRPR
jgi:hypothetical protein